MKRFIIIFCLLIGSRCLAEDGVTVFQSGLQSFQSAGADAFLRSWLNIEEEQKVSRIREDLTKITRNLGAVVETQVFKPKNLGRHILRLYGVLYFEKRPLWIRAEYYSIGDRSGFTSIEYSLTPDDILPLEWSSAQ